MRYCDLDNEGALAVSLLIQETRLEFEHTFGFGFEKPYPFVFMLDESSKKIKIGIHLRTELCIKNMDLMNYQRRYQRNSPKYSLLQDSLIVKKNKLVHLQWELRKYINWFHLHNVNHELILVQIEKSMKNIEIALDMKKLKQFDAEGCMR